MNLISNVIPDIPRIYTAIAEWSACIVFAMMLPKRFDRTKTVLLALLFLVLQSVFLVNTGDLSLILWIPCMVGAVGLMYLLLFTTCRITFRQTAYYTMLSFVLAEFTASFYWLIYTYLMTYLPTVPALEYLLFFPLYLGTNFILYKLICRHMPRDHELDLTSKDYYSVALITVSVFAISNLSFLTSKAPFSSDYNLYAKNLRTLVDLGGLAILYAHFIQCCEIKVRNELNVVQNMLQMQYQQYKYSRESIDLINIKYHDLKHQIEVLRNESDEARRNAFLDQMEEDIHNYDLQNKTGNPVLDTLLTSKSLYCAKHGITLTTVANGSLLQFMSAMDIASIFGNAMDNAIESVLKIKDKEKRLIHITVSRQHDFLQIIIENFFEGELPIKDGKLITTKEDTSYHGYGIASIRYTVEKYDGAVAYSHENHWFKLTILIPLAP